MAFINAISSVNAFQQRNTVIGRSSFTSSSTRPQRTSSAVVRRSNRASEIRCSDMGLEFPTKKYDESFRIGVIRTRWNKDLIDALREQVVTTLKDDGLADSSIVEMEVPGAFELPMAARLMCAAQKVDAVICLGVLIKGDTHHYEYIASAVSSGLMDLQLTLTTPMIFGVLCCPNREFAEQRSTGDKSHAEEWAKTALEMANLKKSQLGGVSSGKKSVGFF